MKFVEPSHFADPAARKLVEIANAIDAVQDGRRAARQTPLAVVPMAPVGLAPLLENLIAQYAATGLPPAYLPKDEREDHR